MARVTVIVPTHNKKEPVAEALRSVLSQTFRDFEIVVSDDGSTDGTPLHLLRMLGAQPDALEILSRMSPTSIKPFSHAFSQNGVTVQYHYGSNRGLSAARNRGIRSARGDYIAFIEAEDEWQREHLEVQMAFLESHPDARLCRVAERYVKDGKPRKNRNTSTASGWIFEAALEASPMSTSALLAHRSCFASCGAFDENLPACDEYDLWLRFAARYPIYYIPDGPIVTRKSARGDGSSRTWSWDRFRVYALEKAFQSGHLSPNQRFMVAQEIVRKCERLVQGFRRQRSDERSNFYERKRRRFAQEVRKLRSSKVAPV
ncbi:MAG: glycosyltransferase family 2 protein [Candidatus Eisenbacteria sp.]|nr:glycosyltransferase family 2 protein [Candidatus Eisenbacteria bacterium]